MSAEPPPPTPAPAPAPPPAPAAEAAGERVPRITPGLILHLLPHARAATIANLLRSSVTGLAEHRDQGTAAAAMLSLLSIAELQRLAREVGVSDAGGFNELHERLAAMC
ncbi:MAG TPA: hypothetical protein VD997_05075 [Phycisphaerales bacterium]|nr:hypothetical protein [Phycisphaerales bacterium]